MYINSVCSIGPAGILTDSLQQLELPVGDRFTCKEPSYKDLIPPMQLRRMSKTIRTGVAAAKLCMQQAGIEKPDGIHIGTAYGVLDDSEKFLDNIITQSEQTLTPTAFIQSTHNTVSGQIALSVGCNAHNMTFVHRAHSFESALLDAELCLNEKSGSQVLLGTVDEITDTSDKMLQRFGVYNENIKGGEGATFFILSKEKKEHTVAAVKAYKMFVAKDETDVLHAIKQFIEYEKLEIGEDDVLVCGTNIMDKNLAVYDNIQKEFFPMLPPVTFKQYSGEYPTATAFGLAYAVFSLKEKNQKKGWLLNNYGNYWTIVNLFYFN